MDIITFLSKVIDSLAWPGVVMLLAYMFRLPLTNLINRIRSIYKEGNKFGLKLGSMTQSNPDASEKNVPEEVKSLSRKLPIKAVEKSWETLEDTAVGATQISMPSSLTTIAGTLVNNNILTKQEAEIFFELGNLKDEALSGKEIITDVSSGSYANIAYTLAGKIKDKIPNK